MFLCRLPSFSFFLLRGGLSWFLGALVDGLLSLLAPDDAASTFHVVSGGGFIVAGKAIPARGAVMAGVVRESMGPAVHAIARVIDLVGPLGLFMSRWPRGLIWAVLPAYPASAEVK